MQISGKNLIGKQLSASGTTIFQAKDPAQNADLAPFFTEATVAEVDQAVQLAESAFIAYKSKSLEERAAFLEAIGSEILALGDTLIQRCMRETALPEGRLLGERGRTVNQLNLFAELVRDGRWQGIRIDRAEPNRQPVPKPDIRQMKVPLGPVGIFGASNFPLAFSVAGGDTTSALAAGCPVVVKGHPLHPGTSELVGKAILKAAEKTGMPEGVFSLVQGPSSAVGMAIVQHPLITAIGFTGSFRGGKAIFDAANQRPVPIPVFAEMGSTNPVFILPGALQERGPQIAEGLAASVSLGAGQFCTNPGLVITQASAASTAFVQELSRQIGQQPVAVMLSESIRDHYNSGTESLSHAPGVTALTPEEPAASPTLAQAQVFTTDAGQIMQQPQLQEEVFGPSTLHVLSQDKAQLLDLARQLSGHLTATIHGTPTDLEAYPELLPILERKVGRLIFNGYPTGVEVSHAMVHGGPFPATTAPQSTSVGTAAIFRFLRPVCYQGFPESALPQAIRRCAD
ncbi:MAG: aldehyde dehydrogenase (NADP(+)) [Phaeodactylibacter sp.]|nr:aldehyde dehydrogenase (NADP(+)) [Phaeodactylibacter sp.]